MDTFNPPITPKAGIELLGKMDIIEFAVQAVIIGDASPLTSSANQRRNMSLLLADVAATFAIIATRIDPLASSEDDDGTIRWEACRNAQEATGPTKLFALPPNAFEESMERVGTEKYLAESNA